MMQSASVTDKIVKCNILMFTNCIQLYLALKKSRSMVDAGVTIYTKTLMTKSLNMVQKLKVDHQI